MIDNKIAFETFLIGAKSNPGQVIVPCANNEDALEAIKLAIQDQVISGGILIGKVDEIKQIANKVNLSLDNFNLILANTDIEAADLAVNLLSKSKGSFLLKGQIDTKYYLKAILNKEVGLVPSGNTLTHVAVINIPNYHKLLISTDAGILINPEIDDKLKMIRNAIDFAKKLDILKPKVSLQAAVEKVNYKMLSTVHAEHIVNNFANSLFNDAYVEGPHDVYIATDIEAAKIKKVTGNVIGDADILCFHDINSANLFYKTIQRFVPGSWAASLIAGAKVPIMLPSRADDAQTKRMSILLAAYISAKM